MKRHSTRWSALIVIGAALSAGCDSPPGPTNSGGPPVVNDASDVQVDAEDPMDVTAEAAFDVTKDPSADDGSDGRDVGCTCSPFDSGIPISAAELSMPCYCGRSTWPIAFGGRPPCDTYDEIMDCANERNRSIYVDTYTNCNWVTVGHGLFNAVDLRVYDGTSHVLVGAMRGDDYPSFLCDPGQVGMVRTGIVPGAECTIAKTVQPCRIDSDGGSDQ